MTKRLIAVIAITAMLAIAFIAAQSKQASAAQRGHGGPCVMQAVSAHMYMRVTYACIPYNARMCLLPSADEGYIEGTPIICVNSGKHASMLDFQAAVYAASCVTGGYVPCYVP